MKTNQKGFSLVELLVVVIIIAIIAAIAIPNLLASRRAANEASAISTLRTIHSAEVTYQAVAGNNINYGTLASLLAVGLVDATLGTAPVSKSGYNFAETISAAPSTLYCATAAPTTPTGATATGTRYFSVAADGVIYQSTAAATCAAGVWGAGTSSSPIQ
jgi:type IV pilus assembly protein PilA